MASSIWAINFNTNAKRVCLTWGFLGWFRFNCNEIRLSVLWGHVQWDETYLQKRSRCARTRNAERRTNIVTGIFFLHTSNLEGSFRCYLKMTVNVVRKHQLLWTLFCPKHRWLRVPSRHALEFRYAVDPCFGVLWFRQKRWQSYTKLMRVN